jgi:XTP/dITP diphosphohydrolase
MIDPEHLRMIQKNGLLVATHNTGKAAEIIAQLKRAIPKIQTPLDYHLQSPEEPYESFSENALCKALYAMEQTGMPALADDSGLILPALEGAPGVHTAEWFTNSLGERCFHSGFDRLNKALTAKPRQAELRAVLALIFPDKRYYFFEKSLQGVILEAPRGSDGFGFDPIFQPLGETRTLAEMSRADRAQLSPRAQAAKELCDTIILWQ